MSVAHALIAFTFAAGLLTITPGLDTALVLRTAALEGGRRAMLAGLGICFGCLSWALAASVGLGALLAASQFAYHALRIIGACYLIYLGGRMLLHPQRPSADASLAQESSGVARPSEPSSRWFVRGYLTNILNPKVGVFYVTFLPLFIPAGVNVTGFSILLALIHNLEGLLWFLLLVLATRTLSAWLHRPRVAASLDRASGGVLVGFGLGLALDSHR